MKRFRDVQQALKKSVQLFMDFKGLKLSAALSYYTLFSIGPVLIIIMTLTGIFFGKQAVQGKVFGQLNGLLGNTAATQIQDIIQNIQGSRHNLLGSIIAAVLLLIGASGVFSEIQESINYMWEIPPQTKKPFLQLLSRKLLSLSLIGGMAFILLVSLIINSLIDVLGSRLMHYLPASAFYVLYILNLVFIVLIITALFATIFKILPDVAISWKLAFKGAFFTALLFLMGKFLIGLYLGNSKIGITYGAAASVVVILLWVYYSSIILYFGAACTKTFITLSGHSSFSKHGAAGQNSKSI